MPASDEIRSSADTDVAPPPASELPEIAAGTQVGRFTLLKRIGVGGMGVVYLAYDPELDRRVALKLLRESRAVGDAGGPARLRREAQAMAKLSHPNVVAVFDVGTHEGALFLAMEYVRGVTLREWQRAEVRSAREVLGVYLQAGRALAAAHSAGILHRDFKPENILLDESGRARVLDFGIARAIEGSAVDAEEAPGAIAGTPAYMAPEQLVDGETDARSDQFSFCVALHEGLYGKRPYGRDSLASIMSAVMNEEVAPPSRAVDPRVRAVLLRGLKYDRANRFPSMTALLAELEKAVAAGDRRKVNVTTFAVAASIAVVGVALALRPTRAPMCQGLERDLAGAWDPAVKADVTRGIRAASPKNGEATIARVVPALDAYAGAWTAMSVDACEATRVRGTQSEDALDLRTACLQQRAKELRATARVLASADGAVVDRAVNLVNGLGSLEACADLTALRTPTAPPRDPAARAALDHVRDLVAQAKALYMSGRYKDCAPVAKDAADQAAAIDARALGAEARYWAALNAYYASGAKEAAAAMFDAAVAAEGARHDDFAAEAWTWLDHFVGYALDRPDEGDRYARLAQAAIDRRGGDALLTAHLLKVRANVLFGQGKKEEALALYRQEIALFEKQLGPDNPRTVFAHIDLADDLFDRGDERAALAMYRKIADKRVATFGETNPDTVLVLERVAAVEVRMGLPTALAAATRANEAAGREDPDVELALGQALVLAGRADEGFAMQRRAIALAPTVLEADQVRALPLELVLGLVREGRMAEAEAELAAMEAEATRTGTLEKDLALYVARARWNAKAGHARAALADAVRVLALARKDGTTESQDVVVAELSAGEAHLALGAPEQAVEPLQHALTLAERGIDPVLLGDVRFALARALVATHGDAARAAALARAAAEDYARAHHPEHGDEARAWMVRVASR